MKKFTIILIFILIISSNVYALSDNFKFMLNAMEIATISQNGYEINEEIYKKYNQFVYGSPLVIGSGQRWKDVNEGRWTKGGGMWTGAGIRGEYWVLGFDIKGNQIHNHQFPVDVEPPTPPTMWRYVELSDAEKSWTDTEKYMHEEQKIYMQTQNLTRNGFAYDITALDIGLNKARAENYATWKTAGNIYTKRYDINNKEWAANFIVPPMAADASLNSTLELPNGPQYLIPLNTDEIIIPVKFGCQVINLTDYAKPEHIKLIKSDLLLESKSIDSIQNLKCTTINKSSHIIINKNNYLSCSKIELVVSANSMLLTEYTVDGALTDVKKIIITIIIEGREEEPPDIIINNKNKIKNPEKPAPRINTIKLGRVSAESGREKIIDLNVAKKTSSQFISAGQVLVIQAETANFVKYITLEIQGNSSIITLDELTQKFEYDEPKSRKQSTRYSSLSKLKNSYKIPIKILPNNTTKDGESSFIHYYVIPYKTKQTLHSWASLREISNNAYEIDNNKLFSKINDPYILKIKAYSSNGVVTKSIQLDIFERWDTLYNRDISAYVR
jgi:hypothetical protein